MPRVTSSGPNSQRPARFLEEARRFALVLAACAACAPPARAVERPEGPPPWRVGGRVGFTVDAASFPDSAGQTLEIYLRVPPTTIDQLVRDDGGIARLRATVRVRGGYGARTAEASQDVALSDSDTTFGQGKVVLLRFPATPGPCRIEAKLADLQSRKPGLIYSRRNATQSGAVRGTIEVPKAQAGRDLSDLEFVWPAHDAGPGLAFVRGGRALLPNPDRLYGLFAGTLEAAFTARAKPGDERPWHWVARVFDGAGNAIAQRETTAEAARMLDGLVSFDLSNEPSGGYDLEVKAWQEGDAGAVQRRERFSVGWHPGTWLRSSADLEDEVHFLLDADDEDTFLAMQPGEQERYLEDFWRKRDPTPETARNEAYDTFHDRVAHANAHYSRAGIEKGMFSDMGRVYIRYGEPSEVLHQVMPAGDDGLTRQLTAIVGSDNSPSADDVRQPGLGGDQRPYEVWVYENFTGLPPDADPEKAVDVRRRRMLFLFVDEQGLGHYTLRYSTE